MTTPSAEIDLGALLVKVHRHAWRADAPPLDLELAEVVALLPNLVKSGSVGLVWPRLRHRAAEYGAAGLALEGAYQAQIEHNEKVEREIARVVGHLQGHGIDPVVIKGWAVSRLYPPGIVRPAGDIDLIVPDGDYERAKRLLAGGSLSLHRDFGPTPQGDTELEREAGIDVDLHSASRWNTSPGAGFFDRAVTVTAGDVRVRSLSPEDTLRTLCFHFLGHSAVRPLRLCDIAMMLERRPAGFDWERCLGGTRRQRELVEVTLGLAHHFLGACIVETPAAERADNLPAWLVAAVECQWDAEPRPPGNVLPEILANPKGIVTTFTRRWPDPITATMRTGARFDDAPRLPIRWAGFLMQVASYSVLRLPRQIAVRVRR